MRDSLGHRHTVRPRELLAFSNNPLVLSYLALIVALICAADPSGLREQVHVLYTLLIWPLVSATYLVSALALTLLILALQLRTSSFTLPTLAFHGMALAPALLLGHSLTFYVTSGAAGFSVLPETIYYLVILEIVMIMFFQFVRPLLSQSDSAPECEAEDLPQRTLIIGAEPVPLCDVFFIEAKEHHVQIQLRDKAATYRARLTDLMAQTTLEDGIQSHRSWWVAGHAVSRLDKKRGRSVLHLIDGTEIPVARSRLDAVSTWVNTLPPMKTNSE